MPSELAVGTEFMIAHASRRMHDCRATIAKCCDQLAEEQMWHRGGEHENSVANLLLHLEGNMRQWTSWRGRPRGRARARRGVFPHADDGRRRRSCALHRHFQNERRRRGCRVPASATARDHDPTADLPGANARCWSPSSGVVSHLDHHTGQIISAHQAVRGKGSRPLHAAQAVEGTRRPSWGPAVRWPTGTDAHGSRGCSRTHKASRTSSPTSTRPARAAVASDSGSWSPIRSATPRRSASGVVRNC